MIELLRKMNALKALVKKIPWKPVLVFSFLFLIFLLNTFHEEYPDEYDSIVGGLYITQGRLPYKDWFQHHQPFAYVFAAILLPLAGQSFVRFRLLLAIALFALNVGAYFLLKRVFKKADLRFYLVFLFITAISATYFWGQMLLADTLAAYLIVPAYALVLLKDFYGEEFGARDLLMVSLFTFFAWLTSLTYTYLLVGLNVYAFYLFIRSESKNRVSLKQVLKKAAIIFVFPYAAFFLYLILTGSLGEYFFASIIYNQRYYIYNYPRPPGALVNPLRYAIIIAHDFFNNFFPLLSGVKDFAFGDPFNITLAVSSASFFIYLLLKRKYTFLFPFLMVLIYSTARSNPFAIKETDYQASVYILTSFLLGVFSLSALKNSLDKEKTTVSFKVIGGFLLVLLGAYWFFNSFFISLKFFQKFHAKYMGQAPLVYDRPQVAPIVNQLVKENEYAWIGPFEFKELFYLKTRVPSKYHWFLQHAASSEKIKSEMLADFEKNRPKVIVFKRNYAPWGGDPTTFNYFFTDFLDKNYFRIFELNQQLEDFEYKWKIANTRNFDIDGDFNFDKERKEEILNQLLDLGLIEKVAKS